MPVEETVLIILLIPSATTLLFADAKDQGLKAVQMGNDYRLIFTYIICVYTYTVCAYVHYLIQFLCEVNPNLE